MAYCHECGSELTAEAKFCNECGTEVGSDEQLDDDESEPITDPEDVGQDDGIDWKKGIVAVLMGFVWGGLAAWGTANMGAISGILFLVGLVGGAYYLYQKPSGLSALGSGLYGSALLLPIVPILFYVASIFSADTDTAAGAGQFIGSIIGLVIWGFAFLVIGLVLFAIGYFVNKKANKRLDANVA